MLKICHQIYNKPLYIFFGRFHDASPGFNVESTNRKSFKLWRTAKASGFAKTGLICTAPQNFGARESVHSLNVVRLLNHVDLVEQTFCAVCSLPLFETVAMRILIQILRGLQMAGSKPFAHHRPLLELFRFGPYLESLLPTKNFHPPEEKNQSNEGDGTESSYQ